MWDWLKSVGNGIINVFQGKTWSGEDPDAIKAAADAALEEQQNILDQQTSLINQSVNSSRTLLLVGGVAIVGVLAYSMLGGRSRRFR